MLTIHGTSSVSITPFSASSFIDSDSGVHSHQTEMKGTVRDPTLNSFKEYGVVNEIYAIGHVLAYIFTGRESLPVATDEVGRIIHQCADHNVGQPYQAVTELIADVERLDAPPVQATA